MKPQPEDFEGLLDELVSFGRPDYMIVCDGSGTMALTPSGWHADVYSVRTGKIIECSGCATQGTNNYAELMPFVQALWTLEASFPLVNDEVSQRDVLCVSDSEVTVKCGNGEYARKANRCLWAAVDEFYKEGYYLNWAWVPRNSNPINTWADAESRRHRKLLEKAA